MFDVFSRSEPQQEEEEDSDVEEMDDSEDGEAPVEDEVEMISHLKFSALVFFFLNQSRQNDYNFTEI